MQLLPGAITLRELQKVEESTKNAGIVDVGAGTLLVSLPSMDVLTGDLVLVSCQCGIIRGAADGDIEVNIQKRAGTATIVIAHDTTASNHTHFTEAGETARIAYVSIVRVTGGGTLTLASYGWSFGINSSLAAGLGQLYGWLYRGGG